MSLDGTAGSGDFYSQYDPCKTSRQEGTPRITLIFLACLGAVVAFGGDHPIERVVGDSDHSRTSD